jgi:hypothetical protein
VLDVSPARGFLLGAGIVVVVLLLYDGRRGLVLLLLLLLLPAAREQGELGPADRGEGLIEQVQEGKDQGEHHGGDPGTRRNGDADERHVVVDAEERLHPIKRGSRSVARQGGSVCCDAMRERGGPIGRRAVGAMPSWDVVCLVV